MLYDQMAYEQLKTDNYKNELRIHRESVLKNMRKILPEYIDIEEYASILVYGWHEGDKRAQEIVELLDLNLMDVAAIQNDLETFQEEYERDFEAQGF